MLKLEPMERVNISFPLRLSDKIIESLGSFGAYHHSMEFTIMGGYRDPERDWIIQNYARLKQRIESFLAALEIPDKPHNKSRIEAIKNYFKSEPVSKPPTGLPSVNVKTTMQEIEASLEQILEDLDGAKSSIKALEGERDKLKILSENEVKLDQVGDFRYIFVKVGLIKHEKIAIFRSYCQGTQIAYYSTFGKNEDDFLIVTGPIEYKDFTAETLALLNFLEFNISEYEDSDPEKVITKIDQELKKNRELIDDLRAKGVELHNELLAFKEQIKITRKIESLRATISRIGETGLIHGWVPKNKTNELENFLYSKFNDVTMEIETPTAASKAPSNFNNRGVFGDYELFTRLRGTPDYFELDPTAFVTFLYPVMFGIMFGDIGTGSIFLLLGLVLKRIQKRMMGISAKSLRQLGGIITTCGILSIFFGFMYGELFLFEAFHPLLLNPLHDQGMIISLSLIYGVIQISIGIGLSVVNKLLSGDIVESIIGEQGIVRLLFYLSGVMLAYRFIRSGMDLNALLEITVWTVILLVSLGIIFLSHLIESIIHREGGYVEKIILGFGAVLETFISLLANSISYIRLAAFAMTHSALAFSAETLTEIIGIVPSYIFLNILVFTIEGLSTVIQSTRLIFYEFFTKFYNGTGRRYKPFVFADAVAVPPAIIFEGVNGEDYEEG